MMVAILNLRKLLLLGLLLAVTSGVVAQVGQYRSEFAAGVNGGYVLSNVGFSPRIPQSMLGGKTAGITLRYTCEKYFNSICAIVAEVNYAQTGWKERIEDINENPVMALDKDEPEAYSRVVDYVQVPVFARLGWGRERSGFQFFFQIGPQLGYYLSEKAIANFDIDHPNAQDRASKISMPLQNYPDYKGIYHMPIENKLDYGITGSFGLEFSNRYLGHFLFDARYYFGLGNIYGNTKRDFFGKSNYANIAVKLSYLFDISKTTNPKIK